MRTLPVPTLFPYTTLFRSLHALDELGLEAQAAGLLDGDDAVLADLVHHLGDQLADLPVRRRDRRDVRDVLDRKSTRLNSSHVEISYAVFCLKKKKKNEINVARQKKKYNDQEQIDKATKNSTNDSQQTQQDKQQVKRNNIYTQHNDKYRVNI